MGQTLTHGIYLPDEGERNCYNGLAANWQLLDGAVGTIAAHTAALAGKAPAVHTHTKADITDFPAYGTTAGTICEGNDSRLSDARTPLSHTHTKADITDLFNSANTWSGINTFNTAPAIKGYASITNDSMTLGTVPASTLYNGYWFKGSTSDLIGSTDLEWYSSGKSAIVTRLTRNAAGASREIAYSFTFPQTGNGTFKVYGDCIPSNTNTYDLGSSSYQWNNLYAKKVNTQSVNGINPGALSLPDDSSSVSIDTTNWNISGGFGNSYTPVSNGWLHINIKDTATSSIFVFATNKYSASVYGNGSQGLNGRLALTMPVLSGVTYAIIITAGSVSEIYTAKFFPCKGNV